MRKKLLILIMCVAMLLSGCAYIHREAEEIDPYLGKVEVFNGYSNVWIVPEDNVPVNTIEADDFIIDPDGNMVYCGGEYSAVYRGIDVSSMQRVIDWEAVHDAGIDFAIIRAGGRYYGSDGSVYEDSMFKENLKGALDAGLKVGVYFFSQAISTAEAIEEAELTLSLLDSTEISMPVFFDWERMQGGRALELDGESMTECALAFCETIEAAGYEAGIYFNLDTSYYGYEMARLTDYVFWCATPGEYPYCYYAHTIWQYSFEGSVPGIQADCDMDMLFVK